MEPKSLEIVFEQIGFGKFQWLLTIICGMIQMFDAMEMLILAYLQPILKCVWQMNLWEESIVIACVFIGMMIGGPIMGRLCDLNGRRSIFLLMSFSLAYFSLLCAATPTVLWITVIRTIIGFCLGGIMSSLGSLASELMPVKHRSTGLVLILAFWPIGAYLVTILCITIVPSLGWRMFLFGSCLPIIVTLPVLLWFPESPRYLLLKDRKNEAVAVLNRIASFNNAAPITDVLQPVCVKVSIWDLFHINYLRTTLITAFLWMNYGLTYFSAILIIAALDTTPRQCLQNFKTFHKPSFNYTSIVDDSCCLQVTWSNSMNVLLSTSGELAFIPLTLFMVSVVGRKYSLAIFSFFIAISFILMNVCMPPLVMSILLLALRGAILACINTNCVYTSEVFPTSVRSTALGLCNTSARVGAIMSPFIINFIITKYSFFNGTIIFTFLNFLAFIAAMILPYETKGRPLFQTAEEFMVNNDDETLKR